MCDYRLVLVHNEVKGRGLCALANSLKLNTSLVAIYIWGNELEESACIVSIGLRYTDIRV